MLFSGSPIPSIGMEFELQLLQPESLDLSDALLPLMNYFLPFPWINPEYNQATIEIKSRVCANVEELAAHLYGVLDRLFCECNTLGITLCGGGLHPFCARMIPMTPNPRYLAQQKRSGYLSQWITYALHVHVGMPDGDTAIAVMRHLKPYLPLLLALSANSPLWRGIDTGFASFRQRLLATRRSYGIPPSFESWQKFVDFFDQARQVNLFETVRDLHWDIRPHPDFGTLELRVMDAPATLSAAVRLAAFVHALVVFIQRCCEAGQTAGLLMPQHWWFEHENHFQASRLGLAAPYIEESRGTVRSHPLQAIATRVLAQIHPTALELGATEQLRQLRLALAEDPPVLQQRQRFLETGSASAIVQDLVEQLRRDHLAHLPARSQVPQNLGLP